MYTSRTRDRSDIFIFRSSEGLNPPGQVLHREIREICVDKKALAVILGH